jgi:hypothetical protein
MAVGHMKLDISLREALKEHVPKRVAASNASDLARALIRLDKERQENLAASRHHIAVGIGELDRGEGPGGGRAFAEPGRKSAV